MKESIFKLQFDPLSEYWQSTDFDEPVRLHTRTGWSQEAPKGAIMIYSNSKSSCCFSASSCSRIYLRPEEEPILFLAETVEPFRVHH
jgi:hypothetical protein